MHLHWAISQIDDGYLEKGKEAREREREEKKKSIPQDFKREERKRLVCSKA